MIYVVVGRDRANRSSILRYDPSSDTWAAVTSMLQAPSDLSVFALDRCIYSAGGEGETDYLSTVEKYEPVCDRWYVVPQMTGSPI